MTSFYGEYREKDIISDEEENRVSRVNVDKWIFGLLLVVIGFMPIIVIAHVKEVVSPLVSNTSVLTSGTKGDLFTYYKSLIILIITVTTVVLLLIKIFFMNGKIRKTVLNCFLGIFAVAIVLSTMLSPNISIALNGQYNRSDGAISWLCYIGLMFIAMNISYPKNVVKYIMYSLYPFVFVNLYIVTMNFTVYDVLLIDWIQKLVGIFLPEGAKLSAGSQLVGTLNQWNYMSGMFAIVTLMFLTWAIVDKSWISSIVNTLMATVSIAIMFMSISTSGFLTVLVILPLSIVVMFRTPNKIKGITMIILFLIISTALLHILAKHNPKVWTESFGFFTENNPYIVEEPVAIQNSTFQLSFIDKAYALDHSFELPVLPERAVAAGSGRVYIWDKTFDLLKERPFIGYGLDSLMYNFPHYNIDARAGMGDENTITDKTHNTFVGIFYGTGIIGFLALVLIVFTTFVYIIVNLFKKNNIQFIVLGLASLAYFAQAMFNDSLPGTSAVAWILIGIMFALIFKENEVEGTNNTNGRDN